jgi:hypothetical protein
VSDPHTDQRTFESPESELESMRTRVTIALTGVLALAIRMLSINMDFLIALGTSVAYFYSVAVLLFREVLPVKVEERDVYFEVSAAIIAFVPPRWNPALSIRSARRSCAPRSIGVSSYRRSSISRRSPAMALSSLSVIVNSALLKRRRLSTV